MPVATKNLYAVNALRVPRPRRGSGSVVESPSLTHTSPLSFQASEQKTRVCHAESGTGTRLCVVQPLVTRVRAQHVSVGRKVLPQSSTPFCMPVFVCRSLHVLRSSSPIPLLPPSSFRKRVAEVSVMITSSFIIYPTSLRTAAAAVVVVAVLRHK